MQTFSKWRLSTKLLVALGALAVLVSGIAGAGMYAMADRGTIAPVM